MCMQWTITLQTPPGWGGESSIGLGFDGTTLVARVRACAWGTGAAYVFTYDGAID